jgi:hypothetical protein
MTKVKITLNIASNWNLFIPLFMVFLAAAKTIGCPTIGWIMNKDLERTWRSEIIWDNVPAFIWRNGGKPRKHKLGEPVSWPRLDPCTFGSFCNYWINVPSSKKPDTVENPRSWETISRLVGQEFPTFSLSLISFPYFLTKRLNTE